LTAFKQVGSLVQGEPTKKSQIERRAVALPITTREMGEQPLNVMEKEDMQLINELQEALVDKLWQEEGEWEKSLLTAKEVFDWAYTVCTRRDFIFSLEERDFSYEENLNEVILLLKKLSEQKDLLERFTRVDSKFESARMEEIQCISDNLFREIVNDAK
jgi:hypothetical protein